MTPHIEKILKLVFVFAAGAFAGGFAGVLIYRLPRKLPLFRAGCLCHVCEDGMNTNVFSYLALRKKCDKCNRPVPLAYVLAYIFCGLLALTAALTRGYNVGAALFFLICVTLFIISVIDVRHMLIPDQLVLSLAVFSLFYAAAEGWYVSIPSRIAGFFILSLPMLLLAMIIPNAFGGGDIKLIAVCGLLLGVKLLLLACLIAVTLGAVIGMWHRYMMRGGNHIPFGQFICAGTFIALQYGNELLWWYFNSLHI